VAGGGFDWACHIKYNYFTNGSENNTMQAMVKKQICRLIKNKECVRKMLKSSKDLMETADPGGSSLVVHNFKYPILSYTKIFAENHG